MSTFMGKSVIVPSGTEAVPITCQECGATIRIVLPISVTDMAEIFGAFDNRHAECVLDKKEKTNG
jgi:hypothetical protein